MYPPPIFVIAFLIFSSLKLVMGLDDMYQLDDVELDDEISSPANVYDDVSLNSDEDDKYQAKLTPANLYYMTPGNDYVDDNNTVSSEQSATDSVLISSENVDGKSGGSDKVIKPNSAEVFIGPEPKYQAPSSVEDYFINSNVDHQTTDTLRSSTVIDTNLNNNLLYNLNTNDSYFNTKSEKEPEEEVLEEFDDDNQALLTTTYPPIMLVSEDIRPTKPSIDEHKISKSELLSHFIADKNLRTPIAFLIDTSNDSLAYTKKVLEASLTPKTPLDAILVRYNTTGVTKSITYKNTRSLMDSIGNLQSSFDRNGKGFYGILRASQEIPYDSAIFIATSNAANDPDLLRMAALTLLKKRIRLYVIWFGEPFDATVSEPQQLGMPTGYLHELAFKTGGRVIHFEIDHYFGNNPVLTTLVSQDDLKGPQTIQIPVDDNVLSLYFKLHRNIDAATLKTPNGVIIDLFTALQLQTFTSFTVVRLDVLLTGDFYLQTSTGVYSNASYSVTVKAEHKYDHGFEIDYADAIAERHLEVIESYANNLDSNEYRNNVRSQKQLMDANVLKYANQTELAIDDESGVNLRSLQQSVTKIDIGIQSQLVASRGATIQIYYEVTNSGNSPNIFYFVVFDELSYLRQLTPKSVMLAPQQTSNVVVIATIPMNAEIGVKNKITFRSQGIDTASQAAWITVADASGIQDTNQPWLYYTYTSRCEGRTTQGTCTGAYWSVEVAARDYESGLMRISSSPRGIINKAPFTAGTRDEVKAVYTASCCQPKVTISAFDVNKNQKTVTLDVTDIWLNELGIATVVLGVLLLIALIILLILLIRCCIKRKRASRDLPVYRSDARTRTPPT